MGHFIHNRRTWCIVVSHCFLTCYMCFYLWLVRSWLVQVRFDTQMATSMYLLFSNPHISLTQQTCRLELCCSGTWAIIVWMGVWMSLQRCHVILLVCKAFFQCMHVKLFVYIELTSLAASEHYAHGKGFFWTLEQKFHNLT